MFHRVSEIPKYISKPMWLVSLTRNLKSKCILFIELCYTITIADHNWDIFLANEYIVRLSSAVIYLLAFAFTILLSIQSVTQNKRRSRPTLHLIKL